MQLRITSSATITSLYQLASNIASVNSKKTGLKRNNLNRLMKRFFNLKTTNGQYITWYCIIKFKLINHNHRWYWLSLNCEKNISWQLKFLLKHVILTKSKSLPSLITLLHLRNSTVIERKNRITIKDNLSKVLTVTFTNADFLKDEHNTL